MELESIPDIQTSHPSTNPDAEAMKLTGDTMTDLQNIANEMGVKVDSSGNVVAEAPAQPETPPARLKPGERALQMPPAGLPREQAAEQPKAEVDVPEKFQNPDGSVDTQKLEKSSLNLDEAIRRYREKEKEFHRLQNKVNNSPVQPQTTNTPVNRPANLSPLEVQMAQDLMAEANALGTPMSEAHAVAQARVIARGLQAKYDAEMSATEDLRQRVEDNERRRELQGLIERDPNLLSGDMAEKLWKVRQENPYLNQSPEPWKAAYIHYLGSQGHERQVSTPTPKGPTMPPASVSPVARVSQSVDITDRSQLEGLTIEQLEALAKKSIPGYRGR